MELRKLKLDGLELVDPNADYSGTQTIFIDFDGAENVSYDNDASGIYIDDITVAHSGLTEAEQFQIITDLNTTFVNTGVHFITEFTESTEFSTIYVGGTGTAFSEYGSFNGLSETIDAGNLIKNDEAFVFSDKMNSTTTITETIVHETGHLLGFQHNDDISVASDIDNFAAVITLADDSVELGTLFTEDFEDDTLNTWPASWVADANAISYPSRNKVIVNPTDLSDNVLQLYGVPGGNWTALAYHEVDFKNEFSISMNVYNGSEAFSGSQSHYRANIVLRSDATWSGTDTRGLLQFGDNNELIGAGGSVLGTYSTEQWYNVKINYTLADSNLDLNYWLDDNYLGAVTISEVDTSIEATLNYLDLNVREGSAFFDDIVIADTVSDMFPLKITASDGVANDKFSSSIAIDGDSIVVGALLGDDNGENSGNAYVYLWNGTTYDEVKLIASDGSAQAWFGKSVAVDDNTIVVSACKDDGYGTYSGSAYVYRYNGTAYDEFIINASDGTSYDEFGECMAISGDTIVVGAKYDNDHGSRSGSVYIYQWDGTNYSETKLTASDGATGDLFGNSVAVDDNTIVVGAVWDTNERGYHSGAVYVYHWTGTDYEEIKLMASDGVANNRLGGAVAVSGNTVVVGDVYENSGQGKVYVYQWNGTNYDETILTASDGVADDSFGARLAIDDDIITITAPGDDNDNGVDAGSVYIYQLNGSNWIESKLIAIDGKSDDYFGYSVDLDDNKIVIGSLGDGGNGANSGSAYVYNLDDIIDISNSLFKEDFEDDTVNAWPADWVADANAVSDLARNKVIVNPTDLSDNVLQLYGVPGGNWTALAYHEVNFENEFSISMNVYNGSEAFSGSQSHYRAQIAMRSGTTWSGTAARGLLQFSDNDEIIGAGGNVLGTYSTEQWYNVKIDYKLTDSDLNLNYWLDNNYLGAVTISGVNASAEAALNYLNLDVREGSAFFDDIAITDSVADININRFDDMSNWTVRYSGDGNIGDATAPDGSDALRLGGNSGWAGEVYNTDGVLPTGDKIFKYDIYVTGNNSDGVYLASARINGARVAFQADGENGMIVGMGNMLTMASFNTDEWVSVEIQMDWDTSMYRALINNTEYFVGRYDKQTSSAWYDDISLHVSNYSNSSRTAFYKNITEQDVVLNITDEIVEGDLVTPDIPLELTQVVSGTSVTLDWADALDDNSGVHEYVYSCATNSNIAYPHTKATLSSEVTLDDLNADTTYYWRVKTIDNAGNASAWSEINSFMTTTPATELDGMSNWTIKYSGDGNIGDATAPDGSDALRLGGNPSWAGEVYTTTGELPTGDRILKYDVYVMGGNSDGMYLTRGRMNGADVAFNAEGEDGMVALMANTTITNNNFNTDEWVSVEIQLDWDTSLYKAFINGTEYFVGRYSKQTSAWYDDVSLHVSNYFESTRTSYYKNITVEDAVLNITNAIVDGDVVAPETPIELTQQVSGISVDLDWADATDDNSGVKQYHYAYSKSSNVAYPHWKTTLSSNATVENLEAETTYYWHVNTVDNAGNASGWSVINSFTTGTTSTQAPTVPDELTQVVNIASISLDWADSTDESGIKEYEVEYGTDAQFTTASTQTVIPSDLTLTNLTNGTYYWHAKAIDNTAEESAWSLTESFTVDVSAIRPHNDFSGDGSSDILWRNKHSGVIGMWQNGNSANWQQFGQASPTAWEVVGSGSFDGSNSSDILWQRKTDGLIGTWEGANSNSWQQLGTVARNSWEVIGIGDFNGNGSDDILWQHKINGTIGSWEGGNAHSWQAFGAAPRDSWEVVGIGDFNGNGSDDILWQNKTSGLIGTWESGTTWEGLGSIARDSWEVVGIGDFDGNGNDDILWQSKNNGIVGAWEGGDSTDWRSFGFASRDDWQIAGVADFNGNSKDDILWQHKTNGTIGIWESGNNWQQFGQASADWQLCVA